jgi:hypothetical protein
MTARTVVTCTVGVLLQLAGVVSALRPGWDEVNLLVGLLVFCLGSLLSISAVERLVVSKGRRDTWALSALLGPVGPILAIRLEPAAPAPVKHEATAASRADRLVGPLLTVLLGVGLLWGVYAWLTWSRSPASVSTDEMKGNEQLAFRRLEAIIAAQERYKEKDWDGDGKRSYAAFHVHLWQSVDKDGNPVPVGLISRELGFAMVPRFAMDGYVYESLHSRKAIPAGSDLSARSGDGLDPAKEWAVSAQPAARSWTGMLSLIAESSGKIWAPGPSGQGKATTRWTVVRSLEHLKEIQRSVSYPDRTPTK